MTTAQQRVLDALRSDILTGALAPGDDQPSGG